MGQEFLSILIGFITFVDIIRGCNGRVWTDNAGGEGALRKGASKSEDHNLLVHGTWLFAAKHMIGTHVERVGTKDNFSDVPSRESYELLEAVGTEWHAPKVIVQLREPKQWAKLDSDIIINAKRMKA